MRLSTLLGSAFLISAVCFADDAAAQGIRVGKLKQITAPFPGGNLEMMAIGYDGDTTESEEKPSLYGVRSNVEIVGEVSNITFALIETGKPNADCLSCELRDPMAEPGFTVQYADIRRY